MMLALSTTQGILLAGIGVALLIVGAALVVSRGRRKVETPDIPRAMRPGPSDPDLETPLLAKLQGWGVVLVLFFVVWIPLTWLYEPQQNLKQEEDLLTASIERGKAAVQLFSEENQGGVGCVRCHGSELKGMLIPNTAAGPNATIATPNLTTLCGGPWTGHPLIYGLSDIYDTIQRGRGSIMPSWSIKYSGALDDQQINDIVNYIVSIQDKSQVPYEHNVCVNPDATKAAIDQFLNGDLSKKTSAGNPVPPS